MIQLPMEVLSYTGEAVIAAKGDTLLFANEPARKLLGEDCVNQSLSALLGEELSRRQEGFVADLSLNGHVYGVRAVPQGELLLFFLSPQETDPNVVNDAFLYSLRSSLMTMGIALDLCREHAEDRGDEDTLRYMRELTADHFRLSRLTENVSMLRQHVSGGVPVKLMRLDLSLLCRACADCAGQLRPDVDFQVQAPPSLTVEADPRLLRTLLFNLIANCLIHAHGLTRIRLNLRSTGAWVILSVADDGCGLGEEGLQQAFFRYRFPFSLEDMNRGAGLGLSLVRIIARLHGGTLLLESRETVGTTVQVSLRKKAEDAGPLQELSPTEILEIRTALQELSPCLNGEHFHENYMD